MPSKHIEAPRVDGPHLLSLSATVGTALAGSDSLHGILQRCTEALVQHLGVGTACIWTLDVEGKGLEMQAHAGPYTPFDSIGGCIAIGDTIISRIVQDRQPYVTTSVIDDALLNDSGWAQHTGMTVFAGYPLIVEDRVMGVMAMFADRPFPATTLKALTWMAGVIAMGIDRVCISDALARSVAKAVRMNKHLRRKNTELDEFTYIASHDLREPLRKLITFSGMLRRDLGEHLPERAERDLEFIIDAATRMQLLIQNLLDLSRVGNAIMHCSQVALDVCVDHALKALAAQFKTTEMSIKRDPLPTVQGDQTMLTQLYQNLLSNALKFRGPDQLVIHLTAEDQGNRLILGVQDNGIGIKPEYHEQIFAPFKRLHGHHAYEGTGIGLAICHKTVERHGGRIWVESDAGQGAHFRFTLAEEHDCAEENR